MSLYEVLIFRNEVVLCPTSNVPWDKPILVDNFDYKKKKKIKNNNNKPHSIYTSFLFYFFFFTFFSFLSFFFLSFLCFLSFHSSLFHIFIIGFILVHCRMSSSFSLKKKKTNVTSSSSLLLIFSPQNTYLLQMSHNTKPHTFIYFSF